MRTSMDITLILSMVLCPKCNRDNTNTAKYCNSCGHCMDESRSIERLKLEIQEHKSKLNTYIVLTLISAVIGGFSLGMGLETKIILPLIAGIILLFMSVVCMIGMIYHEIKKNGFVKELKEIL